ncbi:MAG: alkaline ceramidase [Planctomyces sp.]|nr:alkaline ceramidase [Planctomyces sp.]
MSAERNRGTAGFAALFGFARVEITPPVGIYMRNWGAADFDTAESVHRPLYMTALSIYPLDRASKESPYLLVSADLGWWKSARIFEEMQARVLADVNLPREAFWFSLAHTHAAAPLQPANHELPGGELLGDYLQLVEKKTSEVIRKAFNAMEPGVLDWHYGKCALAKNRDLPDPDRSETAISCGFHPEGLADDTLLVGRVTSDEGVLLGTLINYACHPTTLAWQNRAISPDYVGAMQELVEAETGALSLFLQGASGELAPREQYTGDLDVVDRHGRQLGHAVLATLADMHPASSRYVYDGVKESGAPLAVHKYQQLPPRTDQQAILDAVPLVLKEWPTADELKQQADNSADRFQQERLYRQREIRTYVGDDREWPLPLWCWQLGDAILIGTMAEAYSVLQRTLRERYPDIPIVCVNLLNGSIGYLAPAPLYDREIYQVWQSPFAKGSLERLIDGAVQLVDSILSERKAAPAQ